MYYMVMIVTENKDDACAFAGINDKVIECAPLSVPARMITQASEKPPMFATIDEKGNESEHQEFAEIADKQSAMREAQHATVN